MTRRDRKVNQNLSPLAITTPYHHLTPLHKPLFPQLIYPHYLGLSETVTRISYQFTICNVHLLLKALKGFVVGAVTFLYLTPKDFLVSPYFLILFVTQWLFVLDASLCLVTIKSCERCFIINNATLKCMYPYYMYPYVCIHYPVPEC